MGCLLPGFLSPDRRVFRDPSATSSFPTLCWGPSVTSTDSEIFLEFHLKIFSFRQMSKPVLQGSVSILHGPAPRSLRNSGEANSAGNEWMLTCPPKEVNSPAIPSIGSQIFTISGVDISLFVDYIVIYK